MTLYQVISHKLMRNRQEKHINKRPPLKKTQKTYLSKSSIETILRR